MATVKSYNRSTPSTLFPCRKERLPLVECQNRLDSRGCDAYVRLSATVVAWFGARSNKAPRVTHFEAATLATANNKQ